MNVEVRLTKKIAGIEITISGREDVLILRDMFSGFLVSRVETLTVDQLAKRKKLAKTVVDEIKEGLLGEY